MKHEQKVFIQRVGILAVASMKRTGVLASLTIAQAILETGWGRSPVMMQANALFGVKATRGISDSSMNWKGRVYSTRTKECYDGVNFTTITDLFRAYDSWDDSVADHANVLMGTRYNAILGVTDYKMVCEIVHKSGYATDPNYAAMLIKLIEQNRLYEYDRYAAQSEYVYHVIGTFNEMISGQGSNAFRTRQRPNHNGCDYVDKNRAERTGDVPIFAFADGIVNDTTVGNSIGYSVSLCHAGKITTRYFHLKAHSVTVRNGQSVKRGDIIGVMGTTGESTGVHLHFETKENSTQVNASSGKPEPKGTKFPMFTMNNGTHVDPEPYLRGVKTIGGSIIQVPIPASVTTPTNESSYKGLKVGSRIKILPSAEKYVTGEVIPARLKGATDEVMQFSRDGQSVLLKEIYTKF